MFVVIAAEAVDSNPELRSPSHKSQSTTGTPIPPRQEPSEPVMGEQEPGSSTSGDEDVEIQQAINEDEIEDELLEDREERREILQQMLTSPPPSSIPQVPVRVPVVPGSPEFREARKNNYHENPGVLELYRDTPNPDQDQIWTYVHEKYKIGNVVGGKKYYVYTYPQNQRTSVFSGWEECVGITVCTSKQDQDTPELCMLEPGLQVYLLGMEHKFIIQALLMKRKQAMSGTAKYLEVVLWVPHECLDPTVRDLPWNEIPNEEWIRVVEINQVDYTRTFSPETYEGFCDAAEWEISISIYAEVRSTFKNLKITNNFRFPEHLIPKSQRGSAPRPPRVVPGEEADTEAQDTDVEQQPSRPASTQPVPELDPKPKRSRKSTDPYSPVHQMREDKRRSQVLRMSMGSGKKRKVLPKAKKQSRVRISDQVTTHEGYRIDSELEMEYEEPALSEPEPEPAREPRSRTTTEPRVEIRTSDFSAANVQRTTPAPLLLSDTMVLQLMSQVISLIPVPLELQVKNLITQTHAELVQKVDSNLSATIDSNQNVISHLNDFGTIVTGHGTDLKNLTTKLDSISSEQKEIKESIRNLRTEIGSLRTLLENQGSTFTMDDIKTMEQRRDFQEKALIEQLKSFISMILPGQAVPFRAPHVDYHSALSRPQPMGYSPYVDPRHGHGPVPQEPVQGYGSSMMEHFQQQMVQGLRQADQESGYEDMTRRRTPEKSKRSSQSSRGHQAQDLPGTSVPVPDLGQGVSGTPSSDVQDPWEMIRRLQAENNELKRR